MEKMQNQGEIFMKLQEQVRTLMDKPAAEPDTSWISVVERLNEEIDKLSKSNQASQHKLDGFAQLMEHNNASDKER